MKNVEGIGFMILSVIGVSGTSPMKKTRMIERSLASTEALAKTKPTTIRRIAVIMETRVQR